MAGTLLLLLAVAVLAVPVTAEEYVMVDKWGSYGSGEGQLLHPVGIAVDSVDNVYVVDQYNHRIQKFDSSGNYLDQLGSYGTDEGHFNYPSDVVADSANNIYVVEHQSARVQKFDANGNFLTKWGSWGANDGQFKQPQQIAVDAANNVYVADFVNYRIQKFDSNGTFLTKWGSQGSGDGQFMFTSGVAVDTAGNVYVVDHLNSRVQVFDSNGTFLRKWGGQFNYPRGIAVDVANDVYVADWLNHRVQKFDSDGIFLTMWGSMGSDGGKFNQPYDVASDSAGNIYVADAENNRIQKFALMPAPTFTGIVPNSGPNNGLVSITDLSGTGFIDGATVKLTQAGEPEIVATDVSVVSSTQIACTLDLTGAATGSWNVVVANPGGQPVTLADGFTVTAGNQAPVAVDDTYTTDEGVTLSVDAPGVLANDEDPESETLMAILVTGTTNGALTLNDNGSFTYAPEAGWSGTDTFTYTANDSNLDSNVATVTITVNPVNEAPTAVDDTYVTDENIPLTIAAPGVLDNDDDPDGDTLAAVLVVGVTNGTLTFNPDGSFTYTPNAGWSGNDTFTYTANDSLLASNVATVTITVNAVNEAPVAVDDNYTTDEGTTLTVSAPGVLANDDDPDGDALTAALDAGPGHGTLTLNPDGSFIYTPESGFSGTDSFTYTANDGTLGSATATVTITVNPVNEAPITVDDTYATDEGVTLSVNAPGVLANDDDPDADTLTAVLVDGVSHGTLTLNPDGSFVYTPDTDFAGTDSFTYRASDGELESATATVTITVTAVNHPPVAAGDACTLEQDTTHTEPAPGVLANDDDPDGDDLTAVLESSVSHGSLTLNTDGSFTYTPNAGWSGIDTFTYKAFDGELYSDVATVTITVTEAANNPPEVTAVTAPTDPQLPGSLIQVTGTFTDPDAGDTHTATWTWGDGATSEGTVDEATGTVSGSHTYTAPGTCTITLTVTDSEGASGTGTTTVTVQTPAEATTDLITRVESLELSSGIENGLTSKLDNAIEKLNKGNERTAVNQLNAFINQVKAQRGKKIPTEEADALIAMAQRIIESI